jgi:hypothetical protein
MAIHFVLQGKGGVGKTIASVLIATYLQSADKEIRCYDTDPVNPTFSHYKGLNVEQIQIMDGAKVNQKLFDSLIIKILDHEGDCVIDNGASSFIPLMDYIQTQGVIELLVSSGKTVYVHTVITGGQGMKDTLAGYLGLVKNSPDKGLIVWVNNHFGEVASETGKHFFETKMFTDNESKILGAVTLNKLENDTFLSDFQRAISAHITLDEAIASDKFNIMEKQRLKIIRRNVFSQLEKLDLNHD